MSMHAVVELEASVDSKAAEGPRNSIGAISGGCHNRATRLLSSGGLRLTCQALRNPCQSVRRPDGGRVMLPMLALLIDVVTTVVNAVSM